jgi:uncharacterized protein YgiM (DUF1202 family)
MSVSRLIFIFAMLAFLALVPPSRAGMATVSGVSRIYLRGGPGTSYAPNGFVAEGEAVTTTAQVGNWHRVQTADGRSGYIYGGYLSFVSTPSPESAAAPPANEAAPAPAEPTLPAADVAPTGELGADAPSAPASPDVDDWEAELASLKAEVARLRSEVGDAPASPGITLPTRGPVEISSTPSETSNLRTAGVAVFFLIVGWVFGAGFARRRTRSQRGRLRY